MPIYEYQCSRCSEIFEAFQKITDLPLTECRSCGGRVERLISQSSFQLKGSGWYLTDYSRKSQPSDTSASNPGSTKATETKGSNGEKSSPASSKTENKST